MNYFAQMVSLKNAFVAKEQKLIYLMKHESVKGNVVLIYN